MEIAAPSMDEVEAIADLWVALARGQRAHGSHVEPEANRATVRESLARHVVTGGVLAAYDASGSRADSGSGVDSSSDPDPVGFVTFGPESGGYTADCDRGVVQNIYVAPECRGEGVGSALLSAAEERLVEEGMDVVSLEVMADNDAARRFYARHGYREHRVELEKRPEIGEQPGSKRGEQPGTEHGEQPGTDHGEQPETDSAGDVELGDGVAESDTDSKVDR